MINEFRDVKVINDVKDLDQIINAIKKEMNESYSFKILTKPNAVKQDDEYLDYKANKKDGPTVGVDEALSREGRRKLAQSAKINAKRNVIAREKAAKKKASPEKLQQRAQKKAREMLKNKLLKGKSINDISMADRERLEAKLDTMTAKIKKIAKKLLPDLKKAEEERLQQMRSNESVDKLDESAKDDAVKIQKILDRMSFGGARLEGKRLTNVPGKVQHTVWTQFTPAEFNHFKNNVLKEIPSASLNFYRRFVTITSNE